MNGEKCQYDILMHYEQYEKEPSKCWCTFAFTLKSIHIHNSQTEILSFIYSPFKTWNQMQTYKKDMHKDILWAVTCIYE